MTLEELQGRDPFSSWSGEVDAEALEASTRIYKSTLAQIVAIGPGKSADAYLPSLNAYVEQFNELDVELGFITTIEREDIAEHLAEILEALALPGLREIDDLPVARDW